MINKTIRFGLFSSFLIFLIVSCGAGRNLGTPVGIDFQPAKGATINYGNSFKIQTYLIYDSGKRKEITGKKGLEYTIKGAERSGSLLYLPAYPKSFIEDTIDVAITYTKKELNFSKSKRIPYNFKGEIKLEFSGEDGEDGEDGGNGGTALLFRDGKDGSEGDPGKDGENGHDLSIHIYLDSEGYMKMRVMDVITSEMFFYRFKNEGFPIKLSCNGGNGGKGGDGGDGGSGKDGKKTEKKEKLPGDGGNGGVGGNGGNGGNGGTTYVFVHVSAQEISKKFGLHSIGGNPGEGGNAGKAGSAGTPLEGQTAGVAGVVGLHGAPGVPGAPGQPITISIEEFDIDF